MKNEDITVLAGSDASCFITGKSTRKSTIFCTLVAGICLHLYDRRLSTWFCASVLASEISQYALFISRIFDTPFSSANTSISSFNSFLIPRRSSLENHPVACHFSLNRLFDFVWRTFTSSISSGVSHSSIFFLASAFTRAWVVSISLEDTFAYTLSRFSRAFCADADFLVCTIPHSDSCFIFPYFVRDSSIFHRSHSNVSVLVPVSSTTLRSPAVASSRFSTIHLYGCRILPAMSCTGRTSFQKISIALFFTIETGFLIIVLATGATFSAHLTIDFPVCFTTLPVAFAIGLAKGTGASCDTFKSPAIFSARIGFVFSNLLHWLDQSCNLSVWLVSCTIFCTTGDT